jgi:hypothetical protein
MNEQQMLPIGRGLRPKWFNSPVTFHRGMLTDIAQYIPDFDRQDFCLSNQANYPARANERLDVIIRKPIGTESALVPIGIVSKDYVLVKHAEVVETVTTVLKDFGIDAANAKAYLSLTQYGERMAFHVSLPDEYAFDPGDGNMIETRLECLNSVEGSTRFRAMIIWFRLVCSNGLAVGITEVDVRRRHIGDLDLADISKILVLGIGLAKTERENFRKWRLKAIPDSALIPWVNKNLKEQWGFKAATRAFHIARTGYDVEIIGQYKGQTPTRIGTKQVHRVPGCPTQYKNLFDLSQILSWLAKERRDIQEQLEWREQIPAILKPLMH